MVALWAGSAAFADDFTVSIPQTSKSQGYLMPMKAGGSLDFKIQVTCNVPGPFKVTLDKYTSFSVYACWFTFDVDTFTIKKGQTVTLLCNVSPSAGMEDNTHIFKPFFNARDKDNNNNPFLW